MMCCSENRGRKFWIKRAIFIPLAIVAGVFIFGSLVMYLWNSILPAVLGVSVITFWQALGILVLSKILFGGFRGGHGHMHKGHEMHSRWMHMNPEEREKMKAEWRNRCVSPEKAE
jgi:Ca2+/H+ antiporter, TMEM165/GDT1 family